MRVTIFLGLKTTLRDLFHACIPLHPLELYHLFKDGRFTFIKEHEDVKQYQDLYSELRKFDHQSFVITDIFKIIEYYKRIRATLDNKSLDTPIAIADKTIIEYTPTDYCSGEERPQLQDINIPSEKETLNQYGLKLGIPNYSVGIFIKTIF